MRRIPESPRRSRPGFTLIELLVVIAIIAILMGLLLAGVMRVRHRAIEVQLRNDIQQLSSAVTQFNFEYHVDFIPSRIRLRNNGVYDVFNANPLIAQYENDSLKYLKRVWPRLWSAGAVNWFPDDPSAAATSFYDLSGDQCLVFFLGGIQQGGVCRGFSVNAANPAVLTGSRKQMVDFPATRLRADMNVSGNYVAFVYLDTQGTMPYVYFSNYGIDNGYGRYFALFGASDCPMCIMNGAYQADATGTKYYHKSSFQIISAGIDQMFGVGGLWDASSGAPYNTGANSGEDDLANFHDRMLGIGAN